MVDNSGLFGIVCGNMESYTNEKCIIVIETYSENNLLKQLPNSLQFVFSEIHRMNIYSAFNPKFGKIVPVIDATPDVHQSVVKSADNVTRIVTSVAENRRISIRHRSL